MRSWSLVISLGVLLVGACGDGGGGSDANNRDCVLNGGADCFDVPTAAMLKRDTATPANFNCAPEQIMTANAAINVSGLVGDFQSMEPLDGATVTAFALNDLSFNSPLATATSDANGNYSLTLPSGVESRINWRSEHSGGLPTYALNSFVDVSATDIMDATRAVVSILSANAIPMLIGTERELGKGTLAGGVVDCDGDEVKNAIATVSSTSGAGNVLPTFIAGAEVYYFAGPLPVNRGTLSQSESNGEFVILNIPPGTTYLQIWGFLDAADVAMGESGLTMVSEFNGPVIGDSVISISMGVTQGPL